MISHSTEVDTEGDAGRSSIEQGVVTLGVYELCPATQVATGSKKSPFTAYSRQRLYMQPTSLGGETLSEYTMAMHLLWEYSI